MIESEEDLLFVWPIRGHFLLFSCSSFDSKLPAREAVFGLFIKAAQCEVGQVILRFPLGVPFERVF